MNEESDICLPGEAAGSIPDPMRNYDTKFVVTKDYRDGLPDVQNATGPEIQGSNVPILQVGISNFRLPLTYLTCANETITLETSVNGTVSLPSEAKGINMSRIIRTFYEFKDRVFTLELLEEILLRYKNDLGSSRARLKLNLAYPMLKRSLRSDEEGYQYYDVVYEGMIDDLDRFQKRLHVDFVYSSACPCSVELAEHAGAQRNVYSIPHAQRSKARIIVEAKPGSFLSIEDVQGHALAALQTETQVIVRREDEQAFAELNGAYPKFVEDAVRLVYEKLDADPRILDFQVVCAHLESLHSFDAVAVVCKGIAGGFNADFDRFDSLIC